MSFTRTNFDSACKAYAQKYPSNHDDNSTHDELLARYPSGWSWKEHKLVPGLGYLARLALYPTHTPKQLSSEDVLGEHLQQAEADPAEASAAPDVLTCRQYVVFSSTFQVPAFYFSMHHKTGAPLTLREIVESPLFRAQTLPNTAMSTFALDTPDSAFAMLSQGDHPTLGTPCWCLHPCHTAEVVEEIIREVGHAESDRNLRWLEAWVMVLSNLVNFGAIGR
ncbi:hypothetical protein BDY19DRAFT_983545 [Irpex rosettiformis]|uniref:Uncharacterized protein n=1 Tax=Irpex rosettiformis TaxID=378272 RepID=A0ACB8UCJ4_9APHY|nr:hypothetical protein BDY19DRAFT_983545 [Irpex rosettiformis]